MKMKDMRPYMLWAHIQWLDESGVTPHITIQNGPKTVFPPAFQSHSVVTFNIATESVQGLRLDENGISFSARFSGREFQVFAPLDCLLQLSSKDGQIRIALQQTEPQPQDSGTTVEQIEPEQIEPAAPVKPSLTEIKGGESDGIKRGKLTLVPQTMSETPPFEPEAA